MADTYYLKTLAGPMKIILENNYITAAEFVTDKSKVNYKADPQSMELGEELNDYLSGYATKLTSKYKLSGTSFQLKVWNAIKKIPYGETMTYSELAKSIGFPTSCRAVANACGQNKLVFFIPCHRVVGKNNLGGYKWGLELKSWILDQETTNKN